jgi:hypothetical protein
MRSPHIVVREAERVAGEVGNVRGVHGRLQTLHLGSRYDASIAVGHSLLKEAVGARHSDQANPADWGVVEEPRVSRPYK